MARKLSDALLRDEYLEGQEEAEGSFEPVKSLAAGTQGLVSSLQNAGAAVTRAVGADTAADALEQYAARREAKAAGIRSGIPTFEEADSLGDYGRVASDWLFSNLPLAAATVGTGGVGGAAARLAGGGTKAVSRAATAGAAVPYGATTTGETYNRLRSDPNAEGTAGEHARASLVSGALQAALGLGPLNKLAQGVTRGMPLGRMIGTTAGLEGLTEAGEAGISRFTHSLYNKDVNLFDEDARNEYLQSLLAGIVVGGGYGVAGAGASRLLNPRARAAESAVSHSIPFPGGPEGDHQRLDTIDQIATLMRENTDDADVMRAGWQEIQFQRRSMADPAMTQRAEQVIRTNLLSQISPGSIPEETPVKTTSYDVDSGSLEAQTTSLGAEATSREAELASDDVDSGLLEPQAAWFDALTEGAPAPKPETVIPISSTRYGGAYVTDLGGVSEKLLSFYSENDPSNKYEVVNALDAFEVDPVQRTSRSAQIEAYAEKLAGNSQGSWKILNNLVTEHGLSKGSEEFVKRHEVIQRTPVSIDLAPEERKLQVTLHDLTEKGKDPILRNREKPRWTGDKLREITIKTPDGTKQLDAVNLTRTMMTRLNGANVFPAGATLRTKAAIAFMTGVGSVAQNTGLSWSAIDPDTIIWQTKDKAVAPLRYGDLRTLRSRYRFEANNINAMLQNLDSLRESWRKSGAAARPEIKAQGDALKQQLEGAFGRLEANLGRRDPMTGQMPAAPTQRALADRYTQLNDLVAQARDYGIPVPVEVFQEMRGLAQRLEVPGRGEDLSFQDADTVQEVGELGTEAQPLDPRRIRGTRAPAATSEPLEGREGELRESRQDTEFLQVDQRSKYYRDRAHAEVRRSLNKRSKQMTGLTAAIFDMFGMQDPPIVTNTVKSYEDALEAALGRREASGITRNHNGQVHHDANVIYISPSLSEHFQLTILMHEIGHTFERKVFWEQLSAEERAAVTEAYNQWFDWVQSETVRFRDVVDSREPVSPAMANISRVGDTPVDVISSEYLAYYTSFPEWFADQVAKWTTTDAKPVSVVEKFFAGLAKMWERLAKAFLQLRPQADLNPNQLVAEVLSNRVREVELRRFDEAAAAATARRTPAQFQRTEPRRVDVIPPAERAATRPSPSAPDTAQDTTASAAGTSEQSQQPDVGIVPSSAGTGGAQSQRSLDQGSSGTPSDGFMGALHEWYTAFKKGDVGTLSGKALKQTRAHMAEFLKPDEQQVLVRAASGGVMQAAMRRALAKSPAALEAIKQSGLEPAAYLYALVKVGAVKPGDQTKKMFDKFDSTVGVYYSNLFGEMTDEQQVRNVLDAIERGEREGESLITLSDSFRNKRRRERARVWRDRAGKWFDNTYGKLMMTPFERLSRTRNPALEDVARMVGSPVWDAGGRGEGFIDAKTRKFTEFSKIYTQALGDKIRDKAFKEQVSGAFLNKDAYRDASSEVRSTVDRLRVLFDALYDYTQKAGVKFSKRGDYFPWRFNQGVMEARGDELRTLAYSENYASEWESLKDEWVKKGRVGSEISIRDFIDARIADLTKADGVSTTAIDVHNPGFRNMNPRDLNFLMAKGTEAQRALLTSFMERDLDVNILNYITSAVKRSEAARHFGDGGEKVARKIESAREQGATEGQVQLAKDYVNAALGMHGTRSADWLKDTLGSQGAPAFMRKAFSGERQGVISRDLQNTMGWAITYQNYRLLGLSVFSSFVDPLAVGVRAGDVGIMGKALKDATAAVRDILNKNPSELLEFAEMLGTVDQAMVAEELAAEYTGHQFTGLQRKLNDGLFKYNMVENMTKFSRLVSTAGAMHFLKKHHNQDNETSRRYMDELGVLPGDVVIDGDKIQVLDEVERADASPEELARDDRVRVAIRRFVDGANVRPDVSKRPLWMSDPHFALIGHLKTFAYAFHDTVIRRVGEELKQGNVMPLGILAGSFVPMMLFADWLRDMVQYGLEGPDWKEDWTWVDHLEYAAKRAGLYGRDEITDDVLEPLFKGDVPRAMTEALGPTASQVRQVLKYGIGERELPLQNVFRNWGN